MDGSRIGEQIRTGHQPHGLVFDASGMVAEIHHNSWKPRKYYERKQLHSENLVEWKQKVHVKPWWRRVVEDEVRWKRRLVEEEG
ncbi:hypothetical protein Tco_0853598, partial [Tanacetum coccineum]